MITRIAPRAWALVAAIALAGCANNDEGSPANRDGGTSLDGPPPPNAYPCDDSKPIAGESGYEICQNGVIHRTTKGICPTPVPRPDLLDPDGGVRNRSCWRDIDCAPLGAHGHCRFFDSPWGNGYSCKKGCVDDAECASDEICVCGDLVGTCVRASCRADADCLPGYLCASYTGNCLGTGLEFGCQQPADKCASKRDCGERQFCGSEGNERYSKYPRWCTDIRLRSVMSSAALLGVGRQERRPKNTHRDSTAIASAIS